MLETGPFSSFLHHSQHPFALPSTHIQNKKIRATQRHRFSMTTNFSKLTILGLFLTLGSGCNANRVELYNELRLDEERDTLIPNIPASIQRCEWAINHYTAGLATIPNERESKGYSLDGKIYTDEELEGFIAVEKTILEQLRR